MDRELLEAISRMMDEKLEPIKKDIAGLKGDVSNLKEEVSTLKEDISTLKEDVSVLKDDVSSLKETSEITRAGVNSLLDWAEECGNVIKFPLPKVK